jgi:hypothetical protein
VPPSRGRIHGKSCEFGNDVTKRRVSQIWEEFPVYLSEMRVGGGGWFQKTSGSPGVGALPASAIAPNLDERRGTRHALR